MATLKEVQQRIQGVKNTQKITRAMKIVSATKLKKWDRERSEAEFYSNKLGEMLKNILQYSYHPNHPLMREPHKKTGVEGYIILASDRGLCGSFNSSLLRLSAEMLAEKAKNTKIVLAVIGKKAHEFYKKLDFEIVFVEHELESSDRHDLVKRLSEEIAKPFLANEVDSWTLLSNRLVSKASFNFASSPVVPVKFKSEEDEKERTDSLYLFEDDLDVLLGDLIQRYLSDYLYTAILESQNAEEAARMMAMDQATENAEEMIGELTLFYNRTRQQVITKEISEIVGGAEELK